MFNCSTVIAKYKDLPKYQKIEVAFWGLILPTVLLVYTVLLLLSGEAVFWGRSATIIYHASEAVFVSLLWFGLSGFMYSQFLFRPLGLRSGISHNIFLVIVVAFMFAGLLSAIVFI